MAARIARTRWTVAGAPASGEQVLVSHSGLRTLGVMWVLLLFSGLGLATVLYTTLEPQEDPLLTAAVVGGITFAVFVFGLLMRPVTLARMTRTGGEIAFTTLSRRGEVQRYSVADVEWVRHHRGTTGHMTGTPESVAIKLRGRRFALSVYPNFKQDNCDLPGLLALSKEAVVANAS